MHDHAGVTSTATSSQRRILVFRIGSLGDTLVALPALRRIRAQEPDARIVLLTKPPVDGGIKATSSFLVLSGSGLIDDFIEYQPDARLGALVALIQRLRKFQPHRTIYLMPVRSFQQRLRDLLFLRLAGCSPAQGLTLKGEIDRRVVIDETTGRLESEAARLYRAAGGSPAALSHRDFALGLTDQEREEAVFALANHADGTTLAVSIGTKSPSNDWGQANWASLLTSLAHALPDLRLVLLGSADERARSTELSKPFGARVFNLCGALSPRQSGAVLAHCDLFIGHDSGPLHLAGAAGIPLIGIFSARNLPGIWYPHGADVHVFYNSVDCRGCGLDVCVAEGMRCIRGIAVEDVMRRALSILSIERPLIKETRPNLRIRSDAAS